jgi:glycosyltransferase involved in cell wall biosynthesis
MSNLSPKQIKNKPVILQVLPELNSGGVERGTVELSKALVKHGYTSLVASAGGNMEVQIKTAGGIHFELPLATKNPFLIRKNATALARIIKDYDVDIVHARSRAPAWSSYMACKKTGCHFVTTVHGPYSIGSSLKKRYNSVMVHGEKVIAVSEFIKKYIIDNYEIDEKNIEVIHRGVDLTHFDRELVADSRTLHTAEKLKIEHDLPIILLPARLTEWKGHEFLLDALANIDKTKFRCIFVGNPDKHPEYLKRIRNKIEHLGLTGNISVISNVTDMPVLYNLVDIVVSASLRPEAFGRIAVEAQAMEKLLIATNHGGECETVIDGKTGWLVEPNNVEQLAKTIEKLLSISDEKRKEVTSLAKQHIRQNFSLDGMTSKTIKIYEDILKKD